MSNLFGGTPLPGRFDKVEKADLTGVTQVASTINVRDKEMRRRFERAENMRRDDINEAAGYDLASIGQFGSEIFQQEVDEATQLIASGQLNPTEARAKLGELKSLYNQFNTHAEAMSTEDAVANKLATDPQARAARNKAMGIGEELSYGLDDYATQHNLALNQVFVPGSAQKGDDGTWTVEEPTTGRRVPFSQVKGFADPSAFYQYGVKAVDVGTLGDWAQDKSTASAISFKDGKWDERRARDFYRDKVLSTDDDGKTHRLQILGTLEDRGLVDHLTDRQKQAFRDGENLEYFKFKEIIEKGETEFVNRSQFEGTYGTSSKRGGGGSGSDSEPKRDFVVGGLNVQSETTGEALADLAGPRALASHNLNRFNKPPVLEGAFEVPGKPNTENIQIVGAGVNEKGEQVAYIRGKQRVEVEGAIPGIEGDSDLVPYFKEIPIGGSASGVSSDVMREIQQNHPEMYRQILQDQDAYEENKLRGRGVRPSSAQTGGPDTGDDTDKNQASLAARDAVVDEMRDLIEEGERLGSAHMQFLENGRLGELRRGQFGDYLNNIFPPASQPLESDSFFGERRGQQALGSMGVNDESSDRRLVGLERATGQVPTREEARARQREQAAGLRRSLGDVFFDNPVGRAFGYQGPEARASQADRESGGTSTPVQVPQDQVADLRDSLSPTMQDRLDRALDEAVRRGADGVGARRNENGDIVVTDRRGVPVPGLTPIAGVDTPEARPAGEVPNPALERSPITPDVPTSVAEIEQRQEGGIIRNNTPEQAEIAEANAPAAQEIIDSEATTPTPEAEELVVQELQNSPAEISKEELSKMSPVDLALRFIGTNEVENKDVVQDIMAEWIGEKEAERLDVTTGNGAWCAAFVSKILSDTGHADTLDVVRGDSKYNLIRARRFERIGESVDKSKGKVGDVIVIQGSRAGNSRHVGIFVGYDDNGNLKILGGNQNNEVNVTIYDADRLVSLRRPFKEEVNSSQIADLSEVAVRDSTRGSTR